MVTRVAVTTGAPGVASSFTPTLPTHAAGDRLHLIVTLKYDTATTPTINQGWSLVSSTAVGTGTAGNDAGTMEIVVFYKDATSGAETAPTVTAGATAPNSWEWVCASHRPASGKGWRDTPGSASQAIVTDTNTASPLSASSTLNTWSNFPTAGDAIFVVGCIPTDLGTALDATSTYTCTGLSGGTLDKATTQYIENALGADTAAVWLGWTGFTGTASANPTASLVVTGAANHSGGIVSIALRETGDFSKTSTLTGTGTLTATGSVGLALTTPQGLLEFSSTSTGAQNHTSASFTPRANSTIYVWHACLGTGGFPTSTISDSGGRTWTQVATITDSVTERAYLWSAPAGASPTSMTVTFTGSATQFRSYAIVDVAASMTIKTGQQSIAVQSTGATTTTGAMPAAATTGNTVIAFLSQNDDTADGVPLPTGFTNAIASAGSASNFFPARAAYRTDFTGTTVTVAQNDTTNSSGGAVIELETGGSFSSGSTLSGTGSLSATGLVERASGSTLSGTGSTTTAGVVARSTDASLSGTGSLTATGAVGMVSGASLSGTGSLTAAGSALIGSAASLSGTGALTATGAVATGSGSTLSGAGSLTAAGTVATGSGTSLSGTGSLTTTGQAVVNTTGAASLAGTGSVTASGNIATGSAASLSGTGSVTTAGVVALSTAASLSGTGALTASAVVARESAANLSGTGAVSAAGVVGRLSDAAVSGVGTAVASGAVGKVSVASLAGDGSLDASGAAVVPGSGTADTLEGSGTLTASGSVQTSSGVSLSGSGALAAAGATGRTGAVALTGVGTVAAGGVVGVSASVAVTGTGTITGGDSLGLSSGSSLTGLGGGTSGGTVGVSSLATLPGAGLITADGVEADVIAYAGTAVLAGTGVLVAAGVEATGNLGPNLYNPSGSLRPNLARGTIRPNATAALRRNGTTGRFRT